jgi:signal transduction histidine kinase/FixJ family two-component response regulator
VTVHAEVFTREAITWLARDRLSYPSDDLDATHVKDQSPRVLIADDNADMREHISRILNDGYEITAVADGAAALQAARENKPDLVLADVMMPGLDGFGLLRELRTDESLRETPIILISARAGEEARTEGIAAGADDYITKPFNAKELLARVRTTLDLQRIRREARETERRSAAWLEGQKEAFQAAVNGSPLVDSLGILSRTAAAEMGDGARCAFYVQDAGRTELHHVVGMPEEYARCVDGFKVCAESLACGLAAHSAQPVIIPDVTKEPLWKEWVWLAEKHGFRGCWSFPIETSTGTIVGALAMYFKEPREAAPRDLDLAARLTHTASIIISRDQEGEERRRAEEILRASEQALLRANADLEQFAYSASHDLQEPLRTVKVYSELLTARYKDSFDAEGLEYLGFVATGATRMETLVRDLLAYTYSAQLDKPDAPQDTGEALRVVLGNLQGSIEASRARITYDPMPPIRVHPIQLQQIFQNLVGNAIKYCRPDALPIVHIAAARENGHWHFSVSDNGIGIEPQYKERIFGLFKRLHTGDEYSGTGIGLALCQRIVERYHGRIWVESEPGRGSTFHFILPA